MNFVFYLKHVESKWGLPLSQPLKTHFMCEMGDSFNLSFAEVFVTIFYVLLLDGEISPLLTFWCSWSLYEMLKFVSDEDDCQNGSV